MLDAEDYQELADTIKTLSYFDGEDKVIRTDNVVALLCDFFEESNDPRFSEKMFKEACGCYTEGLEDV
uniref:Uncharacterized protein n=1 Tax=viral metagenome TaxID=1070528 RepID=A0A6M3JQN8_9ZZZZ